MMIPRSLQEWLIVVVVAFLFWYVAVPFIWGPGMFWVGLIAGVFFTTAYYTISRNFGQTPR